MTHRRRRRRRIRRKENRLTKWYKSLNKKGKLLVMSGTILSILILCVVLVPWLLVSFFLGKTQKVEIKEEEIIVNEMAEEVGEGYTNFVLFGGDSRSGDITKNLNTDTIIIVSLNNKTKEVKMVSVYRDTLLDLTNGKVNKCNSAYRRGGAAQAINMLNMNLDLNIKKYVTVDFTAVVDLVDMVGGIEVEVSEKERLEANKFIAETARVAKKQATYISKSGLQTLNGVQATTYARIRKGVGDDYARTDRQRLVIQKVVEKAMKSDLATINRIVNELLPRISTNFTSTEVLSYAKDYRKYTFGENSGFPFEKSSGSIRGIGSSVFTSNLKKNVSMLHEFLFGTEGYQPSATVSNISANIAEIIRTQKLTITEESTEEDTDGDGSTEDGETPGGSETPGGNETPGGSETPGGGNTDDSGNTGGGENTGDSSGGNTDTGTTPGTEQTP